MAPTVLAVSEKCSGLAWVLGTGFTLGPGRGDGVL